MSFSYVSAGHPTVYLLDTRGSVKAALDSTCIPLGIMADASIPEARTVALEPGDILVCVTDGLIEAESATGIPFGSDRLLHVVALHRHERASRIIDSRSPRLEPSPMKAFMPDAPGPPR